MIITPVTRGTLCATAHPDGCSRRVQADIERARTRPVPLGPRAALVIGCSAGLGLAARMTAAFGSGAATVGVCLERPGTPERAGTAGWYNAAALQTELAAAGLPGWTVVGDAFRDSVKTRIVQVIRQQLGTVDLVVYSVAAPRRVGEGRSYRSVLKTIGIPFTDKTYDPIGKGVITTTMPVASLREIRDTVAVMGGDDWLRWMETLHAAGVLAPDVTTVAFSYVGNSWLAPTYREATIGKAKEHLEWTAHIIDKALRPTQGRAHSVVARALVTQASSTLPIQNLYAILLQGVTRERGLHETTLDQAYRLFADYLYGDPALAVDEQGRIRLDGGELRPEVQLEVRRRWKMVETENLAELGAVDAYRAETLALYGFGLPGIDYTRDTDPVRDIPEVAVIPPGKSG